MSSQPQTTSHRRISLVRRVLPLLLTAPILAFSWLVLVPAPTSWLWLLSLIYVELGYVLFPILVVGWVLLDRSTWHGKAWAVLCIAGMGILLSPWINIFTLVDSFPSDQTSSSPQQVSHGPGTTEQTRPLLWHRFFWIDQRSDVTRKTFQIPVTTGKTLPLDFYQTKDQKKPLPLVVVIHGGGWRTGNPRQLPAICWYLASRGYVVASITHRLAPQHRYPTQLQDVTAALQWLRSQAPTLPIDPNRIALFGRSAGGHLALLASYRNVVPGIRAVISLYAPADLHWSWANPSNPWVIDSHKVLREFLGGTPQTARQHFDDASPIRFVSKETPATLLIHGLRDDLVSYKQSRRLAEQLRKHGVFVKYLELPWANHAFDFVLNGPSGQFGLYLIEGFLRQRLAVQGRSQR